MNCRHSIFIIFLLLSTFFFKTGFAQLGFDLKIDKPEPYQNRVLRAEKTGEKPLRKPKKFLQNLTTHYNYYFNASNRLNEVINGAKTSFREDYTELLPFYNYSLTTTAQNSSLLDSVIYKSQTGIVMHDLRNDWIDNLYMLWGAAWFFEKKFDSAALMFQFINYAFAEKEKDGYYRYIGSRMDGNNALSISTKENHHFPKSLVTSPSRNNALLWQVRTLIENGNIPEAGSLIVTLRNDPFFPSRLTDDLEEIQAYWFYKQQVWDSSAIHLKKALGQASNKQERARWEYLAGQMLEKSGKFEEAQNLYAKSISHTIDPVMDVYARLNMVRINQSGDTSYIDKNISELLRMVKRDKYADFRDVIYFMAAKMEMERNNLPAAQALLLKGSKYNTAGFSSRNKSFLLIADLTYDQKKYLQAASFYDSVQIRDMEVAEINRIEGRKTTLAKIVMASRVINREDSLQRIALMPEQERTVYIARLVKQMRKQQGLDDVSATSGNSLLSNPSADLFPVASQQKGDWYFYNTTLKTQGLAQFRQTWGTRPNVDNWRRFSDVNQQLLSKIPSNTRDANTAADANIAVDNTPTFNSLLNNLPLTEVRLKASNDSLQNALFDLGSIYLNEVEDYPSTIETFEKLRVRYPGYPRTDEVLFNLYYSYKKTGNDAKAEEIKKLLQSRTSASRFTSIINSGKDPADEVNQKSQSTKTYTTIYNLFIEGKFEEAEGLKRQADSTYKTNFWQPQLLYIEAVYQIRQRKDSLAKNSLQTLIGQHGETPLGIKAQNLLQVLNRRTQIENELTALHIEKPGEDSSVVTPVVLAPSPTRKDSVTARPKKDLVLQPRQPVDTTAKKAIVQPKPASIYKFDAAAKHQAVIVLDKVDKLFANEVASAMGRFNRDYYYNQTFQISLRDLDADKKLVLVSGFANAQEAVDYVLKAKSLAANEIMPWLTRDKYSFSILSAQNLEVLMENKDLVRYRQFLDQNLPVKF